MLNRLIIFAFVIGLFATPSHAASKKYIIDTSHTSIEFYINHMGFSNFQGEFQKFKGVIVFDEEKPTEGSVDITIYPHSIDTDVEELDNHLESAAVFDAAQFPVITFKSKFIKVVGENKGHIWGALTMHGVTKDIMLETTLNKAALHPLKKVPTVGFSATGKINRSDFGMTRYIPLVSDEVTIRIETEAMAE
ncbi:YceI family protein [Terasakiella sp. A23]|uniref:YceI family protein n=1 Tax=Terasakiella sp. FCG-A23 TaxID=3080561 RepID=UPI0029554D56|nr:YceI family protein [Terasakiella sp. A23]MDV7339551.1 YceI family protein [Terasakiella sp. A23]